MKRLTTLLIIVLICAGCSSRHNTLYPVVQDGKWGYINAKGDIVIKPQFFSAGNFSEGLAPVRIGGTYGYIDRTGKVVIAARYDLAMPFTAGLAKVFINSKPFFIDLKGNFAFQHQFAQINAFGCHSFTIAQTSSRKRCLINRAGTMLTDTVFKSIGNFSSGLAVVKGLGDLPYSKDTAKPIKFETGLIDTNGKWIIPYGRYEEISGFINGFAIGYLAPGEKYKASAGATVVIDDRGHERFAVLNREYFFVGNNLGFNEGMATVQFPNSKNTNTEWFPYDMGAIDTNGKIMFKNTEWQKITFFSHHRAFLGKKDARQWIMIDRYGKQVGKSVYQNVLYDDSQENQSDFFEGGIAYVRGKDGWYPIDTNGKPLSAPINVLNASSRLTRVGDVIFLMNISADKNLAMKTSMDSGTQKTVTHLGQPTIISIRMDFMAI